MADSPNKEATDLVTYKLLSGGAEVKGTYNVFYISADYALNRIPSATIKLHDGDVAEKDFAASDSTDFVPGTDIEILAGYEGKNETIFKGIVVSMKFTLDSEEGAVLEVNCSDKAILMTESRNNAYYLKSTDSSIISKLIGNYSGLRADVESTKYKHKEMIQYDATDWDYMMVRADVNGLVTSIYDGIVSIKSPAVTSSPVLSLNYGVDILEFEADLNAVDQTPSVKAVSWDSSNQAVADQSSKEPTTASIGDLSGKKIGADLGVADEVLRTSAQVESEMLTTWANARLLKSRLASLTGSATFIGSSKALPNTTIELKGVGNRFSGNAFVSAVTHIIQDGLWTTETRFGMDDEWFASRPNVNPLPAGGLTPEYGGLMIGKVKKLEEDPDNQNRIQVALPLMQDDNNGIWARLASYYATSKSGNFFIPEVNDEVIVGFFNSDPSQPVILGSLYSSKNAPPYSITKENYTKAIVTKAENKIEFDDEKKIITIQTPGGNIITISDEDKGIELKDQNGNTVTTDTTGIILKDKSGNKVAMSSSGIDIKSTAALNLEAGTDVKISGLNITNSAQVAMKSSGQASAEFSASGQTTIKGAMVMIN